MHPSDTRLTRSQFIAGGLAGAVLVASGSALGPAAPAAGAEPLPELDLAYSRLLVGAELLAADFYARALASGNARPRLRKHLRQWLDDERRHYASVAEIVTGSGLPAAGTADFDYAYPRSAFASHAGIVRVATELEAAMLGAYLGAVRGVETAAARDLIGRIAASEAMHAGHLAFATGRRASVAFPHALTIEQASTVLDRYLS